MAALIQPLVEVPPVPYDYTNERPAKSLDDHVAGVAERLERCWAQHPVYLDLPWFGVEDRLADGDIALRSVLGTCIDRSLRVSPVVSRSSSEDYLTATAEHVARCGLPVAFRLFVEDFDDEIDIDEEVDRLLHQTGAASADRVDLLVDLKHLGSDASRDVLVARSIFSMLPHLEAWRRVVLIGASFPEDLSEVDAATISVLPRREWMLWESIQRRRAPRSDMLFGNYAIAHPVPRELDPRTMRMSASIRYTTPDSWLILKGRNVRQYGFDQYFDLSRALVARQEYSGPDYSWGDRFVNQCATGQSGPGNATTWRKVGTNHHLTLVARQLASQRGA